MRLYTTAWSGLGWGKGKDRPFSCVQIPRQSAVDRIECGPRADVLPPGCADATKATVHADDGEIGSVTGA
jgi:hypothetical protein